MAGFAAPSTSRVFSALTKTRAEAPLLDAVQNGPVADPRAVPDREREADPVDAVVDSHPETLRENPVRAWEMGSGGR